MRVQVNHALSCSQVFGRPIAIVPKEAIGLPSHADMSSESAAEEDLVEITESLDRKIRTPGSSAGVLDPRDQAADSLIFTTSRRGSPRIIMVIDFACGYHGIQKRSFVRVREPFRLVLKVDCVSSGLPIRTSGRLELFSRARIVCRCVWRDVIAGLCFQFFGVPVIDLKWNLVWKLVNVARTGWIGRIPTAVDRSVRIKILDVSVLRKPPVGPVQ